MKLRAIVVPLVALAAVASGIAFAADDPVALRQQLMKQNGQAAKLGYGMIKGTVPFDAAAAATAMMKKEKTWPFMSPT